MVKKLLVVGMAILFSGLLAASTWAGSDYKELEEKIEELSQAFQKLEGLVKDLTFQVQQMEALSAIVKEFSFELKKTESTVRDLVALEKKVEELQPRLLTLEGTIQGMAASFGQRFSVFQGRVFDLETTVQGLDARLKAVEGKVRQLLALEAQLKKLEERVKALEQQLAQRPPDAKRAAALSERLQALEETVGSLSDQIGRNRSRIASLEMTKADTEELDTLRAQVMELERQLLVEVEGVKSQANTNLVIASLGLVAGLVALAGAFGLI
jgi:chromosome segregation ATPase